MTETGSDCSCCQHEVTLCPAPIKVSSPLSPLSPSRAVSPLQVPDDPNTNMNLLSSVFLLALLSLSTASPVLDLLDGLFGGASRLDLIQYFV